MARQCPNCLAKVPAYKVPVYSSNVTCPSCKSSLELSTFSRNISAFVALIIGAIIFRMSSAYYAQQQGALGWVFPVLFAYLAYSITALMILVFIGDLQFLHFEPEQPGHEPLTPEHQPHHHPSH